MSPRRLTTLAGLVSALGLGLSVAGAQTVVYVDDDAPPGGDGTSWETAYRTVGRVLPDESAGPAWPDGGVNALMIAGMIYKG